MSDTKTNGTDISLNPTRIDKCAFHPANSLDFLFRPHLPLIFSGDIRASPAAPFSPKPRAWSPLYLVAVCWLPFPSRYLVERYEIELGHKIALTKGWTVVMSQELMKQRHGMKTPACYYDEWTKQQRIQRQMTKQCLHAMTPNTVQLSPGVKREAWNQTETCGQAR